MSGWARRQRGQQGTARDAEGNTPNPGAGTSNAAVAANFAEQDYGILGNRATQQAVEWNNNRATGSLDAVLSALGMADRDTYDAEVVDEVAEFQQNVQHTAGLRPDGKVGPQTLASIQSTNRVDTGEVDASVLWPPVGASIEDQFDHFSRLAGLFGSAARRGEPLLIALRGVMENAAATHQGGNLRAYDDTYILLLETDEGVGVHTFAGATHAYQAASSLSPNADGRGGGDVGSVRPTHGGESYTLSARNRRYHGSRSLAVNSDPTEWGAEQRPAGWAPGHVPMHRDTNHDRDISAAEQQASETRSGNSTSRQVTPGMGDYGTVVWFHPGHSETKPTGRRFSSIGCLTARQEDVDNLYSVADNQGDIRLIVVEAAEAVQRMNAAGTRTAAPVAAQ